MPSIRPLVRLAGAAALALAALAGPADATRPPSQPLEATAPAYAHAYAHRDCAPWDGSAIRIVLQTTPVAFPRAASPKPSRRLWEHGNLPTPTHPHYAIALWTGEPPIGRWIAIPGKGDHGMGVGHLNHVTGAATSSQPQGRVRIDAHTPDRIRGELRIALPRGTELVLPFDAPIVPYQAMCG